MPPSFPPLEAVSIAPSGQGTTGFCLPTCSRTLVSYVESGQPQVFSVGSLPRIPHEGAPSLFLFSLGLHQEVHLSFEFIVHPIRWERCPLVAADPHACSWLTLQSHRGLASNTLDAYSRALERYLGFLKLHSLVSTSVTRGDLGLYLAM